MRNYTNYARTCGNGIRLARRVNNLSPPRGTPSPRTIIVLNLNFNTAVMIGNHRTPEPDSESESELHPSLAVPSAPPPLSSETKSAQQSKQNASTFAHFACVLSAAESVWPLGFSQPREIDQVHWENRAGLKQAPRLRSITGHRLGSTV